VTFVERIVPPVIPTEEHQHARRQRQHPGVENGLHAEANVDPERLAKRFEKGTQPFSKTDFPLRPYCVVEILRQKPIRPMGMLASSSVTGEEFREPVGSGRRLTRLPPLFQHGALHQTISPAENRQRAEHALAKEHSPKQFYRSKKNSAEA